MFFVVCAAFKMVTNMATQLKNKFFKVKKKLLKDFRAKMKAICSSQTSISTNKTTQLKPEVDDQHHTLENINLKNCISLFKIRGRGSKCTV
jgi:hypothetical protein